MKKASALVSAALLLLIVGLLGPSFFKKMTTARPSYQLKETMLISISTGEPFYMIPKNTVLRFQKGYAEGHQLYTIEVFFKGKLPADELPPQAPTESTWLYQLDADDIPKVRQQYPLSKEDLVRIMKAQKITRDDLTQMAREWKDD
jgi:hypothetical protein